VYARGCFVFQNQNGCSGLINQTGWYP
jgi:hypothetical protein